MVWIFSCLLLYLYTQYKARVIFSYLKKKYPGKWEKLGKPKPNFALPSQTWSLFLSKKKYKDFKDRQLTKMCDKQRHLQRVFLITALLFFTIFGGIALWYR